MRERPTPETDALAENLIFIVEKITEFNAQYVIKQILTEILTKTTKMERERDEAREALMKIEDLFIDGTDIYADREKMGMIAIAALEETK